jgi:uncharacterized protein (TIGR02145 family)
MKEVKFISLAVGIVLTLAFIVSCVGDKSLTDKRDGKKYKTVIIGTQTWMAENLNFAAEGSKCYENNPANCQEYGRLYDWNMALTVCPSGWHLPSRDEYGVLDNTVGGEKVAGKKLKSSSGWNDYQGKSGNSTDELGFSALPGGNGTSDDVFYNVGNNGFWWSANEDEYNSDIAYYRGMYYGSVIADWGNTFKSILFSVRCIQD